MSSKQHKKLSYIVETTSHIKNKHYYCSLSNVARYVVPVPVGLGYKIEVSTHNNKLPDNY